MNLSKIMIYCEHCGHIWFPRKQEPKFCPDCHQSGWQKITMLEAQLKQVQAKLVENNLKENTILDKKRFGWHANNPIRKVGCLI